MEKKIALLLMFCLCFISCHSQKRNVKALKVKEIKTKRVVSLDHISQLLEKKTELHQIDLINWKAFPYKPNVQFRIAYNNEQIWLKFYITEKNILARRSEINSATHKDSCVEFFIDPQQDGNYYNFEFNCIGVTHLAYGSSIEDRSFIEPYLIRKHIKTKSSLGNRTFNEKTEEHTWEMTVVIPSEILIHDKGIKLKNLTANANFYKCGDDTSIPHYLSWNPIDAELPNFHRPSDFGSLKFE